MREALPYMLVVAMAATVITLFAGIVSFAFNSKANPKRATRLMAARVALQGIALLLFGLMVLLSVF